METPQGQSDALCRDYRTSIQAIRDRHAAATDKIWNTNAIATPCPSRSMALRNGKRRGNGRS